MIPEENDKAAGAMTTLMSNEKRKLTLNNIAGNQDASRLRSGSKRYSEPVVGGSGGGYQNPWGDNKRESIAEVQNRKKSNLPGSLKDIGKGLNRKLTDINFVMELLLCDVCSQLGQV